MLSEGVVEFFMEVLTAIWGNHCFRICVITFFVIMLSLPMLFIPCLVILSIFIHVHGLLNGLENPSAENTTWHESRCMIRTFFRRFGRFWHGYEIEGLENIPTEGPALMISYHSTATYDLYFLASDLYMHRNRLIRFVADNALFKIPGLGCLMKAFGCIPGPVSACVDILNQGGLLLIAPGGAYETQFSNSNYTLKWRNRVGYAKVAVQAKAPIIPVFTINSGEIVRPFFKKLTHPLYLLLKVPVTPIYGGFPVKLRTIIGKPIPYDPNATVEEMAAKTKLALENLIREHQRLPGSILQALYDRVRSSPIKKVA